MFVPPNVGALSNWNAPKDFLVGYGVNSLASDSERGKMIRIETAGRGHVCLFGCNGNITVSIHVSTFGVDFQLFFPPAYFHFLWQLTCVYVYSVGCVKEPVSSISRVPPSSTNTQCTSQTFYSRSSNTYRHPHIYETSVVSRQMYPWVLLRRLWPLSDKRKPPFVRFCVSSSFFFILTIPFGRQDATQKR